MKLFFAFSLAAALVASSSATLCSAPAIPKNVTILEPTQSIVSGGHLPPPNPASKADRIVEIMLSLGRTTNWTVVNRIQLKGDTGEIEGMVRFNDDRYYLSSGMYTQNTTTFGTNVIINGTDRTPGAGRAHILVYDGNGTRIADSTLSPLGSIQYHPGGIDFDGTHIYVTIAQYRPNSTATLVRIDPMTLQGETLFDIKDHEGGVVHDTDTGNFLLLNWGARNASMYNIKNTDNPCNSSVTHIRTVANPSFYVDYQDCKFLGHPAHYDHRAVMMCSGVTSLTGFNLDLGGIALVDIETMVPLHEVPILMYSDMGTAFSQNSFDVDIVNDRLRLYGAPDQHNSTLYVIEANPISPREF